jgi:hypothetical protein
MGTLADDEHAVAAYVTDERAINAHSTVEAQFAFKTSSATEQRGDLHVDDTGLHCSCILDQAHAAER